MGLRQALFGLSAAALGTAVLVSPAGSRAAAAQTWPPFVLVAGLLMVGLVAHSDGMFTALGAVAARVRSGPRLALLASLGVVAVVTTVLNLDTSVAFLTPVMVLAARARGQDEEPFLYGTLFMSNAASLLLPGSNLTNLLVLGREHVAGAVFAARMLPAWLASVAVTALFMVVAYRRRLGPLRPVMVATPVSSGLLSTAGVGAAAAILIVAPSPAVPVLAVGIALAVLAVRRRSVTAAAVRKAVDPAALVALFSFAVALGALARGWSGPARLVGDASRTETAALGAVASVALNNLPAAVLLTSRPPAHRAELLLGLNIGPNLAVTGSLSALIWYRAARAVRAEPSVLLVTRLGVLLVPLTLAAAELALRLLSPASM